jgi:hypothetical protein
MTSKSQISAHAAYLYNSIIGVQELAHRLAGDDKTFAQAILDGAARDYATIARVEFIAQIHAVKDEQARKRKAAQAELSLDPPPG